MRVSEYIKNVWVYNLSIQYDKCHMIFMTKRYHLLHVLILLSMRYRLKLNKKTYFYGGYNVYFW